MHALEHASARDLWCSYRLMVALCQENQGRIVLLSVSIVCCGLSRALVVSCVSPTSLSTAYAASMVFTVAFDC